MTNSVIRNKDSILRRFGGIASSEFALSAVEVAIREVEPGELISKAVKRVGDKLTVLDIGNKALTYGVSDYDKFYIVGAGKASVPMTVGLTKVLWQGGVNPIQISGSIITPYGTSKKVPGIDVIEAGHPLPDTNSVRGTKMIVNTLRRAKPSDLVFVLLSGGGSALLSFPVRGITLADKKHITKSLLSAGAKIQDLNIVRMHLSQVKGGKLIQFSPRSTTFLTLVISDVIGDEIQIIASGPTCPNRTSFVDAKRILSKYDIWNVNNSHMRRIRKVVTNGIKEEQKVNRDILEFNSKKDYAIIGNNTMACDAASQYLRSKKIDTLVLGSIFDGDVAEHGKWLSHLANELQSLSGSFAIVLGGETTVRLNKRGNNGIGGRNQESALYALLSLKSDQDASICCVGTDGIDGNSTAAGALVNSTMVNIDRDSKMQLQGYLENHDSSRAFRWLGSQIVTGKTLTNVNDINVICRIASSNKNQYQ